MGQYDIVKLLKQNKKSKLTAKKISELLGNNKSSIMRALATLRKDNQINFEFIPLIRDSKFCGTYVYWHKK